ncbi:MAG: polysaccharide biosynthesis C-terminal domain-containing protein, partial [Methanothrix sp.]|jgi:O-antigen/teichoic acid export membrane protein|nr:polysaccharide biosynthesis C-terminal domain-containing protein [Methanothrix sp.]
MGAAVLNLVMTVLLVRGLGIIGGAIATLVAFAFIFSMMFRLSSPDLRPSVDRIFLSKCLAASLLMSAVTLAWTPSCALDILAEIVICAAVYFLILYILGGVERSEINFLKDILLKKN